MRATLSNGTILEGTARELHRFIGGTPIRAPTGYKVPEEELSRALWHYNRGESASLALTKARGKAISSGILTAFKKFLDKKGVPYERRKSRSLRRT